MNFLKSKPPIQLAASMAREFKIDPVLILNASPFLWKVRAACFEIVQEQKKKEAEQVKAASKKK